DPRRQDKPDQSLEADLPARSASIRLLRVRATAHPAALLTPPFEMCLRQLYNEGPEEAIVSFQHHQEVTAEVAPQNEFRSGTDILVRRGRTGMSDPLHRSLYGSTQKSLAETTSRPFREPRARQGARLIELLTNRTLPSASIAFTPPG